MASAMSSGSTSRRRRRATPIWASAHKAIGARLVEACVCTDGILAVDVDV